jgi:hypothetical protein
MTSRECYENKWFYMKYIGKMAKRNHVCPHAVHFHYLITARMTNSVIESCDSMGI